MSNDLSGFNAAKPSRKLVKNLDPVPVARSERTMAVNAKKPMPKPPAKPPGKPPAAKGPSCSCGGHKGGKKSK